jgi:sugar diacid utilization regulator
MYNFKAFLQDLSVNTGIKFSFVGEDGNIILDGDLNPNNAELFLLPVYLGKNKAILSANKEYEICGSLLKYTIENKYREFFSQREQFLIDILEGKEVPTDKIEKSMPFLSKGCEVLVVSVEGSRYEALNIIRQLYKDQDVLSSAFGDNVVIIGDFEDVEDHARSVKDSITSELYCKSYVSFSGRVFDAMSIKKAYEDAKECMLLGRKFGIKDEIFNYNKMLFEKIVYNINPAVKNELTMSFKDKFNLFDSEMVTTIDEFVNCGLNISDAARKLYIHRNTLIYRLDKIHKETGFDIRNFREATVFIIAFLVWKENK